MFQFLRGLWAGVKLAFAAAKLVTLLSLLVRARPLLAAV